MKKVVESGSVAEADSEKLKGVRKEKRKVRSSVPFDVDTTLIDLIS